MCLSIAMQRPDDVLNRGKHVGHEWMVIHNGLGYRCGYIKVEAGHPWHGEGYDDINVNVHGGLTFAEADEPCDKGGPDSGYWLGFDCAHGGDAPDPSLPMRASNLFSSLFGYGEVRSQEYVESECRSLCEQARDASLVKTS